MREPLPLATVVHATGTRLRLRVQARRGDTAFFERCAAGLAGIAGVGAVQARAMTASLLLHHDGLVVETIAAEAERAGLFIVAEVAPESAARTAPDLPALGAMAFSALGVLQLFNQRLLPPALTLFWYAATLARSSGGKSRQ
jgi:hypothetical protein